ncbi:hypothetical protein BKA62DRAFT_817143 [Auriculariales sp. MPI-PUGE-AT-0066]|nr:hypothetical protein BKA62DRAFT_817143 [Auriculariales sp. MPI-PUGE-AT-0066]
MGRKRKAQGSIYDEDVYVLPAGHTYTSPYALAAAAERYGAAAFSNMSSVPTKPTKRPRTQPDSNEFESTTKNHSEKRLKRARTSCPKAILERVDRVLTQRFCLVDRTRNGDELREEFQVLGSTGNVYTVAIDIVPSCNCPDASKGNFCKHILFVFLKVLSVPQSSTYWYQAALLTSELEWVFSNAPAAPQLSITNARVKAAYDTATGKILAAAADDGTIDDTDKLPEDGDDCGICYDEMAGNEQTLRKTLSWCTTCHKPVHTNCFSMWLQAKRGETCVYCRSPWTQPLPNSSGTGGKAGATYREGYLNLAGVAGVSGVRDSSTYYHGPKRGRRYYGYRRYN